MSASSLVDLLERGSREHYDDAVYYDYTYRRRRDDIAFYHRLARQYGGPVLELGGGTGRVALGIAEQGCAVTVVDVSDAMLARARARVATELSDEARPLVTLRRGDVRELERALGRGGPRTFPLVIAPFNVLLHLYEPDDFARCFAGVARRLARGGRFVFDVRIPNPAELARNPARVYKGRPFRHPTLGYRVEYTETFRYDAIKQVQHVTMRFAPAKGGGAPRGAKPAEVLLTQRQIFPNELRALLALGGLRLSARYGDFTGRMLDPDDAQQIVVATRA